MLYDRLKINKISICKGNSLFFITSSNFQIGVTSTSKIAGTAFMYRLPLYALYGYELLVLKSYIVKGGMQRNSKTVLKHPLPFSAFQLSGRLRATHKHPQCEK